nr:hypothetical protein [uncultured Marvinbryantia sp.]
MMKGTFKKYTDRMAMGVLLTAALLTSGCSLEDGAFVFRVNGRAEIEKETAQTAQTDAEAQQQTQAAQTDAEAQQQTQAAQTDAAVQQQTQAAQTDVAVQRMQAAQTDAAVQQQTQAAQTEAAAGRKPLFRDADGTIHGPQLNLGESGKPIYDYDIEASLADAPQEWIEYTYPGRKQSYLSPSGVWLFKDEDGTIHGAQIGTTEIGSILFDYEFDVDEIPAEWK